MAEVDPPEQCHQPQLFNPLSSVFFTGPESPTHPSIIAVSDSEPDLEPKPIFEPDEDHLLDHHRRHHRYDHRNEQVSFFTNLFQRSSSQNAVISGSGLALGLGLGSGDPNCRSLGEGGRNVVSGVDLELGLGLGFGNNNNNTTVVASSNLRENTRRCTGGLRVVNIDDDSDTESEDNDVNGGVVVIADDDDRRNLGFGGVSDFDRPPYCWDYLGFNNGDRSENEQIQDTVSDAASIVQDNFDGFFVEEVVVIDDEEEDEGAPIQLDTDVSNVFDTYQMRAEQQEIAIDSDTDEGGDFGVEEAIRDLEWEILLAVNNFNREVYDMDFNVDMYEAILGEVEDRMNEWRGSPPTAESVIENLASVLPCREGSEANEVVCAICKDEISEEEVVKQLPCLHYYHAECIVPWLRMRNTCPVCRHELPTDDADYEYRKREREREEGLYVDADEDLSQDSQAMELILNSGGPVSSSSSENLTALQSLE